MTKAIPDPKPLKTCRKCGNTVYSTEDFFVTPEHIEHEVCPTPNVGQEPKNPTEPGLMRSGPTIPLPGLKAAGEAHKDLNTLDDELDEILEENVYWEFEGVTMGDKEETTQAILKLIEKEKLEAVKELKRRWHEDRKTMDFSPATYQFICDKYISELESKLEGREKP